MNPENPTQEFSKAASAPNLFEVLSDKFNYDNPERIKTFFQEYVESIRNEGVEQDPEGAARRMIESHIDDLERGLQIWRDTIQNERS